MSKVSQAIFKEQESSTWTKKVYHILHGNARLALLTFTITVFIPKYRKKQLYGQVRADVREIIQTLCKYKGIEIIEGAVCLDHVHLCVSIPPKMSISAFMGYLKGKSTLMIYDRHPSFQNKWNKAFWAKGYYAATMGNVTEEVIKK